MCDLLGAGVRGLRVDKGTQVAPADKDETEGANHEEKK